MSLKENIHTALMAVASTAPTNNSQFYGGMALTWITFSRYNRMGEAYAENKEVETGHYFLVHLWQKETGTKDLDELEKQVESVLKAIGFSDGFSVEDLYEPDTKINHIAIRCNYVEHL